MIFGSSVSVHGLNGMMRSRTARRNTECSITWFFLMVTGEIFPSFDTLVTQACTFEGRIRFIGM